RLQVMIHKTPTLGVILVSIKPFFTTEPLIVTEMLRLSVPAAVIAKTDRLTGIPVKPVITYENLSMKTCLLITLGLLQVHYRGYNSATPKYSQRPQRRRMNVQYLMQYRQVPAFQRVDR